MKKILCLVLAFMMVMPMLAYAKTTEIGAATDSDYYNVYIAGDTDLINKSISILLIDDQDNIGYVEQIFTDDNGGYELKFRFAKNIGDYSVMVREDATAEDVTGSLKTAFARRELYALDIKLASAGNDVTYYISEGDAVDVVVDINNKYGDSVNVNVILAAYGENNKLLGTKIKSLGIGFGDINASKSVGFSDFKLPDGTKYVKAFAWQDIIDLIPLAEEEIKENRGNIAFTNENPNEIKVIGLVGDSITHHGNYAVFLNQYYATKYPESNILILNKGISGDSASGIESRLSWNIFAEKSPNEAFNINSCDEITVMIGMNDVEYSSFTKGPQEDYADAYPNKLTTVKNIISNIEDIIIYCKENNKEITLVTPSLYDESDRFTNSLDSIGTRHGTNWALGLVAEGVKGLAEEYDVAVLDLYKASNEYSDRIRANYPDATTVITGTDGIHPQGNGGYLFGYLFARAQETNDVIGYVEIDASANKVKTENASVADVKATTNKVSYTYKAGSLPLYKDSRYDYVEKYGVDIENDMNREIIKVTNLEVGNYTITFDGVSLGTFTAEQLATGVNIAELANNPGQIQAKNISTIISNKQEVESNLQYIAMVENSLRKSISGKYYTTDMRTDFDNFSTDDWLEYAKKLRANYERETPEVQWSDSQPIYDIMTYINTRKANHETSNANLIEYSQQLLEASKTESHEVVISK